VGACLPAVGGPVEKGEGRGDAEPNQLVTASADPPEALGHRSGAYDRAGGTGQV